MTQTKRHEVAPRRPLSPAHAYYGVQVRNARCCEQLLQSDAAVLAGISANRMHKIEVGDTTPSRAEASRIQVALERTINAEECERWLTEMWTSEPIRDRPDDPEIEEPRGYWQVSTKDGTVTAYATEEAALASLNAHIEFVPFGVTR